MSKLFLWMLYEDCALFGMNLSIFLELFYHRSSTKVQLNLCFHYSKLIYTRLHISHAHTYPITYLCLGIVLTLIAAPKLALLGVFYKGEPWLQQGVGLNSCPDWSHHFHGMWWRKKCGIWEGGQRMTDQLKLGSSMHGRSNCTCAPAYMVPLIIDWGIGASSLINYV